MADETYYRLIIRFTNGETQKFVLHESVDTRHLSEKARFVLVRSRHAGTDASDQVFLASLDDVSYIKVDRIEAKDLRHRVAGIAAGVLDEPGAPETVSTVEFL
jgi:hypothetical protein